jgi:hypothetical protein
MAARKFDAICSKREPTRDEIAEHLVWGDSYQRLPMIMEMIPFLSRPMLFEVLGSGWTGFDNIGQFRLPLAKLLRSATRAELDLMMTPEERAALAAMPDEITVYRGCYQINRHGLSWSTDINIAARFPTLHRYSRPGEQPILLQAIAYRDRAVAMHGRSEDEVIVVDAHQVEEVAYASA